MKKEFLSSSMPKLIKVVSLIVGVGAVFGILGYYKTTPKVEIAVNDIAVNNKAEKEETQDKEIIQDETADWQTYRNERWKYEVKYPESWIAKKSAQMVRIDNADNDSEIMINTYPNYDSGTTLNGIQKWVETMNKVDCSGEEGPCFEIQIHKREKDGWVLQKREVVEVINKDVWQYTYKDKSGNKISRIIYASFADLKGVEYIYEIELIDEINSTIKITNQILSSFKFIEK